MELLASLLFYKIQFVHNLVWTDSYKSFSVYVKPIEFTAEVF